MKANDQHIICHAMCDDIGMPSIHCPQIITDIPKLER
jgi:hypothetical protein